MICVCECCMCFTLECSQFCYLKLCVRCIGLLNIVLNNVYKLYTRSLRVLPQQHFDPVKITATECTTGEPKFDTLKDHITKALDDAITFFLIPQSL